jgi:protease-4
MNNFFKIIFGSCLGTLLAIGALFLIMIGIGLSGNNNTGVSSDSILKLDFNNLVPEKTNNVAKDPFNFEATNAIGLRETLRLIDHASKDNKIKGILLNSTSPNVGQAGLYNIAQALEDFKASGKWIVSYSDYHSQNSYLLNLAADSIFLNPNGWIDLKGYGYLSPFFKDALDNVGVRMDVFYAGDFKSATESFRRNDMSPENKMQIREFLNEMAGMLIDRVAEKRNMSKVEVDTILRNYAGKDAFSAKRVGLIDDILYYDQVEDLLRDKIGFKKDKKLKYITLSKYASGVELKETSKSKDNIAIVYAEGEVGYGTDEYGSITDKKYMDIFSKLRRNDDLKAIVLRVNSPGGSSITSDIIWRELETFKARGIPVIASFGDYAASGGYYIACGADTIVSSPNTLTGSIGVFSMLLNTKTLMKEKLNIHFDTLKTHPMAVGLTSVYDLNPAEEKLMNESVDSIYSIFLSRVAEGRGFSKNRAHEVGQGRVWTGKKALELGLVDILGDLDDAIAIAADKAKISDYKIKEYPIIKEDFVTKIINEMAQMEEVKTRMMPDTKLIQFYNKYESFLKYVDSREPLMRVPFMLED